MSTATLTHIEIPARELRAGDGLRLGTSDDYVLISGTQEEDGGVLITVYHGSDPGDEPEYFIAGTEIVELAIRARKPCPGCDVILPASGPDQCPRCEDWDRVMR